MSISKNGSALIAGVKASRLGRIVSGDAVERMIRTVGGAWIGGRLTISKEAASASGVMAPRRPPETFRRSWRSPDVILPMVPCD